MSYCEIGETPAVQYKFSDSNQRSYRSKLSPIDVVVTTVYPTFTGGQCDNILYAATIKTIDPGINPPENIQESEKYYGAIRGAKFRYLDLYSGNYMVLCHGTFGIGTNPSGYKPELTYCSLGGKSSGAPLKEITMSILSVRRLDGKPDNCGNPPVQDKIEVKHNGLTIFVDQGVHPCEFEVICSGCPIDYVRCDSPGYPGYCCIPCAELAQRVDAMTRRLK